MRTYSLYQIDHPFCLFHAASLPHGPDLNEIPNGLKGYDANNFLMDAELGQYLDLLERHGLEKNTVVIYLNDNEAQNDRTKNTLYDTRIHIPMVVRWPGRVKPATDIDPMVSTVDMLPTLIEIAGGEVPQAVDGVSMLDVWDEKVKELHKELFFSYTGVIVNDSGRNEIPFPIRAVRTSDFKYIRYLRNEVGHPKQKGAMFPAEEFFNLRSDPGEQDNLAGSPEHQEQKAVLSQKVDDWMAEMNDNGVESELAALKKYPRGKK